jgi:hypothetical protein
MAANWWVAPRRRPISTWLAGYVSAALLMYPVVLVMTPMLFALVLLPPTVPTIATVLFLGAIGVGFATWGGGVLVARMLGLARPALPRATNAANWAGERVGVRSAAVYELVWMRVTVDSFVFSRFLIVSSAAAELLTDEELFALSVREMTFFQQPWLTGGLKVFYSSLIYFMLACVAIGTRVGGNAMLYGCIVGFVCSYLTRPFTRRLQLKADQLAARSVIDPASALKALERQYELNLKNVVAVTGGHREPHLYDRMVAAGIVPAYPRPLPPSVGKIVLAIAAALATCVVLSVVFLILVVIAVGQ